MGACQDSSLRSTLKIRGVTVFLSLSRKLKDVRYFTYLMKLANVIGNICTYGRVIYDKDECDDIGHGTERMLQMQS